MRSSFQFRVSNFEFRVEATSLSPRRFVHPDARNRAESWLLAYARAYGALVDPDRHALEQKRRAHLAASKKKGAGEARAADQFKIRTELLDARHHVLESKFGSHGSRLAAESARAAIDPRFAHTSVRA